jgi:hypothetical protein
MRQGRIDKERCAWVRTDQVSVAVASVTSQTTLEVVACSDFHPPRSASKDTLTIRCAQSHYPSSVSIPRAPTLRLYRATLCATPSTPRTLRTRTTTMADARGEYWWLEPGVDANKITVPQLRRILLTHDVQYSSSAKKPDLVALFNSAVAPHAEKFLRDYGRTKRSARGIQDVPSSSASTVTTEDTEDETLLAPTPATTRRTSRRTTREPTEEVEAPARRAKTPSRAVPAKHSRATEAEADERPAVRRVRKSVTPAVREPSPEPETWRRSGVDSPFTQENPFQSGSSPTAPDTAARDRRRRTMGSEQKERRKSETNRRKTFQPKTEQLDEGVVVPTRDNFDPDINQEEPDVSEEFTPEEQLELVRDRARSGERDILPPRRRIKSAKATGTLKAMAGTLLLTAAAVFGGAWRQEKIAVGFCGVGRDAIGLAGLDVPEWASDILPKCEPCPPHAQCYRELKLTCDKDFIKQEHPLSLNGLVPIPPTCEPDSQKTRLLNSFTDRGVQILRKHRAQYECGEPDADGNPVESPEVKQVELKQQMATETRNKLSDAEFNELFDRAWPELSLRDEIQESTNG